MDAGLPFLMLHENDDTFGGCPFARFFETTPKVPPEKEWPIHCVGPRSGGLLQLTSAYLLTMAILSYQDLTVRGLYKQLALALYSGPFWSVSVALVAKFLGARRVSWLLCLSRAQGTFVPAAAKRDRLSAEAMAARASAEHTAAVTGRTEAVTFRTLTDPLEC